MKVVDLGLERTRYVVIDDTIESRWRQVTSMRHDSVAVVTPRDLITFADLESRTEDLVHEIRLRRAPGAGPIAVDLEPTAESVIHLLATLISGHPLVMIDPQLPEARRAHVMASSGATPLSSVLQAPPRSTRMPGAGTNPAAPTPP